MPTPDDELYQQRILDHYESPFHRGRCPQATHAHEDDNPLCGDVVRIELRVDPQQQVQEAFFDGDGCCISQAAASILIEHLQGRSCDELRHFSAQQMLDLFGAKLTPNRQKCCLLCWRVLQTALVAPLGAAGPAEAAQP
jgi:nitrogen fixation NifU-like protein